MTADDLRWLGLILSSYGLVMWVLGSLMRARRPDDSMHVHVYGDPMRGTWRIVPRPPYDWERDGE